MSLELLCHQHTERTKHECNPEQHTKLNKPVSEAFNTTWLGDLSGLFYRVFQNKLHKVCHAINFEPFVLGSWY